MSITIPDDRLAAELAQVGAPVEVRAPDGQYLGEFTPARLKCPPINISEEELRRRENDTTGKWYTAEEVEAKLRELRSIPPGGRP